MQYMDAVPCRRYSLSEAHVVALVRQSLARVNMLEFAERPVSSLSGGQKQRVAIAGVLCQSPKVWGGFWEWGGGVGMEAVGCDRLCGTLMQSYPEGPCRNVLYIFIPPAVKTRTNW